MKDILLSDEMLKSLTPREEKVIRLRYGLDNNRAHTLEEVGREFGVTRERIRQIEAKAIRRLRYQIEAQKEKKVLIRLTVKEAERLEAFLEYDEAVLDDVLLCVLNKIKNER